MSPGETLEYVVATMRKLILRGMPPPRWFVEFNDRLYRADTSVNTLVISPASQMAPDAALDLLTMHALRWVIDGVGPGLDYIADDAHLRHGDNLLEAIIAATAHLEPK